LKIGIYSDVHANYVALTGVLKRYESIEGIELFACLGDVVGYGPAPDKCCETVRNHARFTVLGNHDAAVAGRMDYDYYYPAARNALDHHKTLLADANIRWLQNLPYEEKFENLCFSHGSPVNQGAFEYVFTEEHALSHLAHWDTLSHITFMGHSHLTKSFRLNPPDDGKVEELKGTVLHLDPPAKYLVTVGSVGQPRDNDSRACCVVLDTKTNVLEFLRIDYDVYEAAESIWNCDYLVPDFGKRLFLGV